MIRKHYDADMGTGGGNPPTDKSQPGGTEKGEEKSKSLLTRKAILWAEIKAHEQEYKRLCRQIMDIENDKGELSAKVQLKIQKAQDIADKLLEQEYEALKQNNL